MTPHSRTTTPASRRLSSWLCPLAFLLLASMAAWPAMAQSAETATSETATSETAASETAASEAAAETTASGEASTVPDSAASSPAEVASEAADETAAETAETEESDVEWIKDEKGIEYRIGEIPKVEGTFRRRDENRVRFPGGAIFEVVRETDDMFYVKVLKRGQFGHLREEAKPKAPERSREEILAEFDSDLESVNRLRLVPFDEGLPTSGQWRDGFRLADMNADGHLDIVFGPARKAAPVPRIFLGDGEGRWRHWAEATFEPAPYDYGDVAVADWNGDGHLDLALGVHLRGILALLGDGEGNFRLASEGIPFWVPGQKPVPGAFSSRAVQAADWNGDGRMDILALGEGPQRNTGQQQNIQGASGFRVYLNQPDGTWQGIQQTSREYAGFGEDFALLDVDGDGRDDVVMGTMVVGSPWIVLKPAEDGTTELAKLEPLRQNAIVDSLATADFDGDGRLDLALAYRANVLRKWRSGIDIYLQRGEGWTRHTLASWEQRDSIGALAAGDLDGDGHQDLVAGDDNGLVHIFLGLGGGEFVREITTETPEPRIGCHIFHLGLGDLDRDETLEVVASYAGEEQAMVTALVGNTLTGCEDGGSIRAWDVETREAEPGS